MAVITHDTHHAHQEISWSSGVWAGVIAGVVFMMLEMFMVWAFQGQSPWGPPRMIGAMLLGRDVLPPPATFDIVVMMVAMLIHFVLSIIYGVVGAAIVNRLRYSGATVIGAVYGLAIYIVNFYMIAPVMFPWFTQAQNWISVMTHIIFGALIGASYLRLRGGHRSR